MSVNPEAEYEVSGSLIDRDPFSARNHAMKMAARRAEQEKRQAEADRVAAIEAEALAARREHARLQKMASLADIQAKRNEEYQQQAAAEDRRKDVEKKAKQEREAREAAEAEAAALADAQAAARAKRQAAEDLANAEQARKDAIREQREAATARRLLMFAQEEEAAEERGRQLREAQRIKRELARQQQQLQRQQAAAVAAAEAKPIPAGAEQGIWQRGPEGEKHRADMKKRLGLSDEVEVIRPARREMPEVAPINPWANALKKKGKASEEEEESFGFEQPLKTVPARLKTHETTPQAIAQFLQHLTADLGQNGIEAFRRKLQGGYGIDLKATVDGVTEVLRMCPGNIPSIVILGLLAFCGHNELHSYIRRKRVIPDTVDGWMGWLYGCRLYFDYVNFKEANPRGQLRDWTIPEEGVAAPQRKAVSAVAKLRQKQASYEKIVELLEKLGAPGSTGGASEAHASVIASKLDALLSSYSSKLFAIQDVASGATAKSASELETCERKLTSVREEMRTQSARITRDLQDLKQETAQAKVQAKKLAEESKAARKAVEEFQQEVAETRVALLAQKQIDVANGLA